MSDFKGRSRAPLYFLFLTVGCQIVALAISAALRDFLSEPLLVVLAGGLTALALSSGMKLPAAWRVVNFLTIPAVFFWSEAQSGGSFFLSLILVLICLLFLPTFWTRVPYYPTNPRLYHKIAELLPEAGNFRFIDLGCGGGRLISYLAKKRPEGRFEGVDISPLALLMSLFVNLGNMGRNVTIRPKNFWRLNLAEYDYVYAFLAPPPMAELWAKAKKEMRPGSVFITNSFPVPEPADQTIEIEGTRQGVVYIHRL